MNSALVLLLLVAPLASPAPPSAAERITEAEMAQGQAYSILQHLTDRIGARLSGSAGAEEAVRWTRARLEQDGLDARLETVMVPHWVRGIEEGEVVAPAPQRLVLTALGGSVPTPEGGLEAEVVEARTIEDLEALGAERVRGRIVLFSRPMLAATGPDGYAEMSHLRTRGPALAQKLGAVGALVRSLGTLSARLPHTGSLGSTLPATIPSAALAAEDAELLQRLLKDGPVRLRIRLGCRTLPDIESANVVADLRGRERPDEIVLIGAHLDSWDLGTGAIDDGAGVAMVMESLRLLKALGLTPRRTIRGVLYMNEENGVRGGRGYAEQHAAELGKHVAAIESDSGAARPLGFVVVGGPGAQDMVRAMAPLFRAVGATAVLPGTEGGVDITPLRERGVPVLGLRQDPTHYFDWHHSAGDTLDKVDRRELAQNAAAMAIMAYTLAEMPETLPRPQPEPAAPH